jgi:D-aspartate ligase
LDRKGGEVIIETVTTRSVLFASASAGGTIAAARCLGGNGYDVGVLAHRPFSAAAWSRRVSRTYAVAAENDTARFLSRLQQVGALVPGQILLPTSDETAWLYALHAGSLASHFRADPPPLATLKRILDKKLFAEAATAAGVDSLPIWDPQSIDELTALAPTLPYPVLIKPRTHVHRLHNDKGVVAQSPAELLSEYARFAAREQVQLADNPHMPDARRPILQQFVDVAHDGVYSVSGFIDRSGDLFVTRRAVKVFLRSYPVGVGVCFEALPADPQLSERVRRLCDELGYHGIFEVEFLRRGDEWAVIDFNPRLFNQLGMELYRGMPLPLFACLAAMGETAQLREAVHRAQAHDENLPAVFYDAFTLRMILAARRVTGRITPEELAYWKQWRARHAAHRVDVAASKSDPLLGVVHACSEVYLGLRAMPRFLRLAPRRDDVAPARGRAS